MNHGSGLMINLKFLHEMYSLSKR